MADLKNFPTLFKHTTKGASQIWKIWVEPHYEGKKLTDFAVICTEFGLLDGKKQTIREVIKTGKNAGKKNATTPAMQAIAEAEARWNKQKERKGYGLDTAESKATRAISPMLAQKFGEHKGKVDWGSAFSQPKLDGFRGMAHVGDDTKILSRENQPMAALSHIVEALKKLPIPKGTILDGELYCHGLPLNKISSACKRKSDLTEKIQYHVYDAILPSGGSFTARSTFVREMLSQAVTESLVGVKTVKVRSEAELLICQAEFIGEGYEGAMLRYSSSPYEAGKRSQYLLKVKTFRDGEFKIIDHKFGRGGYTDIPVFICETPEGHVFDATAPGSLPEKREIGKNVANYIGKKLTIKYAYMTDTDEPVPFQPVAVGFRD